MSLEDCARVALEAVRVRNSMAEEINRACFG